MTGKRHDAPGELELVRDFINTYDLETGVDRLLTAAGLRDWIQSTPFVRGDEAPPDDDDRRRAVDLREALRRLAAVNGGGGDLDQDVPEILQRTVQRSSVVLRFGRDGAPQLLSEASGIDRVLGQILALSVAAHADETWARLKICPNPQCQWAFYDHSRNRSGSWCQMAECGNRAKVRAYRQRRQEIAG
ncbi:MULTISPECIES: CGNR zinc finger domain-containing protein [unclassified Frankia]|uniref:CGNR zinc finger domain-containing protein n=1 Tax=unclassified Frankia TaxID=2632575 RepID=UPI002025913B